MQMINCHERGAKSEYLVSWCITEFHKENRMLRLFKHQYIQYVVNISVRKANRTSGLLYSKNRSFLWFILLF